MKNPEKQNRNARYDLPWPKCCAFKI